MAKEKNEKKNEEYEEHQHVDGAEIKVSEVELLRDKMNDNLVHKILFHTEDGNQISYKPRTVKKKYVKGMVEKKETKIMVDDIPEKVTKIAEWVQKRGDCTVLATYHLWNKKNDDGTISHYRFVQNDDQFSQWRVDMSESEQVK